MWLGSTALSMGFLAVCRASVDAAKVFEFDARSFSQARRFVGTHAGEIAYVERGLGQGQGTGAT